MKLAPHCCSKQNKATSGMGAETTALQVSSRPLVAPFYSVPSVCFVVKKALSNNRTDRTHGAYAGGKMSTNKTIINSLSVNYISLHFLFLFSSSKKAPRGPGYNLLYGKPTRPLVAFFYSVSSVRSVVKIALSNDRTDRTHGTDERKSNSICGITGRSIKAAGPGASLTLRVSPRLAVPFLERKALRQEALRQ